MTAADSLISNVNNMSSDDLSKTRAYFRFLSSVWLEQKNSCKTTASLFSRKYFPNLVHRTNQFVSLNAKINNSCCIRHTRFQMIAYSTQHTTKQHSSENKVDTFIMMFYNEWVKYQQTIHFTNNNGTSFNVCLRCVKCLTLANIAPHFIEQAAEEEKNSEEKKKWW